jgi:phage terminase large subunit GpA-like protein
VTFDPDIFSTWSSAFQPPDARPIWEWANDNITKLPEVYGDRKRFSIAGSQHFKAPFEAIQSPRVHEINVLAPIRGGKTLLADISCPWFITHEQASMLWCFHKDDAAKAHCELRLWTILENSPAARLMPGDRYKRRTQEIIFSTGQPLIVTGATPGNLQARGFRVVILDEPWRYAEGIMQQAKGRMGDFVRLGNHKFLCISQGGTHETDWQRQCAAGAQYEWHVRCMGCDQPFQPLWRGHRSDGSYWGMVWETVKDDDGRTDIEHAKRTAAVECPHCRHKHAQGSKTLGAWNKTGFYPGWNKDTAPENATFHWTALIDFPWPALVDEWLKAMEAKAMGNNVPMVTFIQQRLAQHDNPNGASIFDTVIDFKRADTSEAWPEQGATIMTVDVQRTHHWVMLVSVAKEGGEMRRLFYDRIETEGEVEQLARQWNPTCVAVDVNYKKNPDDSPKRMVARNNWLGLVGSPNQSFEHVIKRVTGTVERIEKAYSIAERYDAYEGTKTGAQTNRVADVIHFASDIMASRLARMIAMGKWVEPKEIPDPVKEREYNSQMSAERCIDDVDKNKRPIKKWVGRKNNHAWDCSKMAVTVAVIMSDARPSPIRF